MIGEGKDAVLDGVTAIDIHTHAMVSSTGDAGAGGDASAGSDRQWPTVSAVADYFRERAMLAVIFPVDAETATGIPAVPNEEVAEAASRDGDVLIPFASIDPWKGRMGARQVHRLVDAFGVRGFKFQPTTQAFFPNDPHVYPLYEAIAEHGLPAVFHSGQTLMGKGQRAGGGVRLKYSNPIYLDDVAVDFPDMPIIIAHPSFPWQEEALAVANHKPQVYIDLSGWSPKYFPSQLIHYANTLLRHKVLYGSDYPLLTPDRWLADFEEAGFRDEVKPLILRENAARLLGLGRFEEDVATKAPSREDNS